MPARPIEPQKLDAEDLKAIVDAEIRSAMGEISGELTEARADAMDRYLGEPDGREMEGRSEVQSRDVLEVIEWILPSLCRIFATQRAIEVDPVGPEDEQQADQETDYLRHMFFKKESGFMLLYTWMKDALLQKNGVVKTTIAEEDKQRRQTYEGIAESEFAALVADEDTEIVEHTGPYMNPSVVDMQTGQPTPLHDVTVIHTEAAQRSVTVNVPPEEFLISRDARTLDVEDARFSAHYTSPTVSDLLEMGFTWDEIRQMELGLNEAEWNEETVARRHLTDEQRWIEVDTANAMMQTVKLTECYIKADMNGDGIAEQLKVWRSGDFCQWEEVDEVPFDALTPIPLPHKFLGLSVADLLVEIQDIRTGFLRAWMDNFQVTLNGKRYYNDRVNVDDMLTSRPWGNVYVEGDAPVGDAVMEVPPSGLHPQAFTLDEIIDKLLKNRIGDFQSQLDPSVLKEANNGVVLEMIHEAKAKVEMIARIFAETGIRNLFRRKHRHAREIGNKEEIVKLRNQWVPVNPASWLERTDFTIRVGLGTRNQQEAKAIANERLGLIERLAQDQEYKAILAPADRVWEALKEWEESNNEMNPGKFWQHPSQYEAPPPGPDPNMELIQSNERIEAGKLQMKQMELQIDAQNEARKVEMQEMVAQLKAQSEALKVDIAGQKAMSDQEKAAMEMQATRMDQQVKSLELALKEQDQNQKAALDQYKAELQSGTQLTIASMNAAAGAGTPGDSEDAETPESPSRGPDDVGKVLASLMDSIEDIRAQIAKPRVMKVNKRDADGRPLIINDQPVSYDENGRLAGIG